VSPLGGTPKKRAADEALDATPSSDKTSSSGSPSASSDTASAAAAAGATPPPVASSSGHGEATKKAKGASGKILTSNADPFDPVTIADTTSQVGLHLASFHNVNSL
jgi:hypothetical protein